MELGDHARAATPEEAAEAGDVVVVSIPLKNYRDVPVQPLAGKTVIDTMNYYPQRDGNIAELDDESTTTSELLQEHLPDSHVVKASRDTVASLINEFGFDVVDAGALSEGWRWQRDTPAYVTALDAKGMDEALAGAVRYADMA